MLPFGSGGAFGGGVSVTWTRRRAMAVLIASNVLWAASYAAGKEALLTISPIELNLLRFSIASVAFVPLLWSARQSITIQRERIPRLVAICLCGFVFNKALEFTGLKLATASDNALLIAAESVFTAIFGWTLLHERVRVAALAGLAISIIGVYLIIERGLVWPALGTGTRIAGDLLIVAALLFEALYTILGKAELERNGALAITAVCTIGSLVVWAPAAGVDVAVSGWPHFTTGVWIGVIYLGLAATTLANVGWFAALRYVEATAAAPTLFIQPLAGTLIAMLVLGDRVGWATALGGALVVVGIWLVSRGDPAASEALVTSAEVLV
jgi:drug/metabolite transporter (DMT)-like permease